MAAVFMDGEAVQIDPISYKHPSVLTHYEENHICVNNPPGSTTELFQAADAGVVIKAAKAAIKGLKMLM